MVPYVEMGVLTYAWSFGLLSLLYFRFLTDDSEPGVIAPLRGLLTACLALGLLGVLRGWRWWQRWLLYLTSAAATAVAMFALS